MTEIIGLEAGGSKTRVVHASVMKSDKIAFKLLRDTHFDLYNYRQDGIKGLNRLIEEILADLKIRDLEATFLLCGVAGAGTDKSHKDIKRTFEKHGFRSNLISVVSDADLLLIAIGNEGIVLSAGTGSICVGRRKVSSEEGREMNIRAGGHGFRMYSEPGGYQLGMRAIDTALKIEDGRRQKATFLHTGVRDYFGVSRLEEIIPLIYARRARTANVNSKIAGISKVVLKAAYEGDKTAIHLVKGLVDNFADHIRAVYNKLGLRNPLVGLHGGLFSDPHSEELLVEPLKQHALLSKYDPRFITLGKRNGDIDPLVEAMRGMVLENKHLNK